MKIRWTGGSIRFRITPTELQNLANGIDTIERLRVGNGLWQACLMATDGMSRIAGEDMDLTIYLSKDDVEKLQADHTEGVYFKADDGVRYFVEKDFPCAHPRAIDAELGTTETFAPTEGFELRKKT